MPPHRRHGLPLPAAGFLALPLAAHAMVGGGAAPSGAPLTTTWYVAADRACVAGMRPRHAGALSMGREDPADPARSGPLVPPLARAPAPATPTTTTEPPA